MSKVINALQLEWESNSLTKLAFPYDIETTIKELIELDVQGLVEDVATGDSIGRIIGLTTIDKRPFFTDLINGIYVVQPVKGGAMNAESDQVVYVKFKNTAHFQSAITELQRKIDLIKALTASQDESDLDHCPNCKAVLTYEDSPRGRCPQCSYTRD